MHEILHFIYLLLFCLDSTSLVQIDWHGKVVMKAGWRCVLRPSLALMILAMVD